MDQFLAEWGVDTEYSQRGGLGLPKIVAPRREVHLLQRKKTKPGATLGKTTGWIHRLEMKKSGVKYWIGVEYLRVEQNGLWISQGNQENWWPSTPSLSAPARNQNWASPANLTGQGSATTL